MIGTFRSTARVAALAAVLGISGAAGAANVEVGGSAPNFEGTWLNAESTTLKDLEGHAVLVEFWATW